MRTDSVEPLMDGVPAHDAAWGISIVIFVRAIVVVGTGWVYRID